MAGKQHYRRVTISVDDLTEQDQVLLRSLREKYEELGRSPITTEMANVREIKQRFGIWKNALQAAGLPLLNDPEQQQLRQAEKEK